MKIKSIIPTIFAMAVTALEAEVITVDNRPGALADYATFSEAYDAASAGDTLLLAGSPTPYLSVFSADLTISKPLVIVGPGMNMGATYRSSTIDGSSIAHPAFFERTVILDESAGGTIIKGCSFASLQILPAGCRLENCRVQGDLNYSRGNLVCERSWIGGVNPGNLSANASFLNCVLLYEVSGWNNTPFEPGVGITFDRCIVSYSGFSTELTSLAVLNSIVRSSGGAVFQNSHVLGSEATAFVGDENVGLLQFELAEDSGVPAGIGPFSGPNPITVTAATHLPRITNLAVSPVVDAASGLRIEVSAKTGE